MSKVDIIVEEIRDYQRQIDTLNTKISDAYKRLDKAQEEDSIELESKRRNQYIDTIHVLWDKYWPGDFDAKVEKELQDSDLPRLNMWLEADIKSCLKKTKLNDELSIKTLITEKCPDNPNINFDACIDDAKIRLDFASALRAAKKGTDLSHRLGWGFGKEDLLNLVELHKKNKFRKKIEDLLEDCNFHSECGLLRSKDYDGFVAYVNKEN